MYEFNFEPVLTALKVAADAGADVQVVVHEVPKKGDKTPQRNLAAIAKTGISALCRPRTKTTIAHNKFIVLLRDGKPEQVWTGSTNVTEGGIFGHANVGHRISDRKVAQRYLDYWQQLAGDPRREGAQGVQRPDADLPEGPPATRARPTVFSSRTKLDALEWYCRLADSAKGAVFLTAAFGLTAEIAPIFEGERKYLRYLLLDLETGNVETVRRDPSNLVAAGGFNAKGGWRTWIAKGADEPQRPRRLRAHEVHAGRPARRRPHRGDRLGELERRVDQGQRREHGRDPRRHARRRHLPHRVHAPLQPLPPARAGGLVADGARAGPGNVARRSAASCTCARTTAGRRPFYVPGSPEAKERLLFS